MEAVLKTAWTGLGLGLAWLERGWGVGGEGAACPVPPRHTSTTHHRRPGCTAHSQFLITPGATGVTVGIR